MIYIKNDEEISLMKKAGKIVGDTLKIVESIIKEGVTTNYLDSKAEDYIIRSKANIYGFHADAARTFAIGTVSSEAKNLIETTCDSFFKSLKYAREGYFIGDISSFIQEYVENKGYSIVKDFTGHGIGRSLHEAPEIPNFGKKGTGFHIKRGMAIAIEPMVNLGKEHVKILDDNWTVVTIDNSLSAHYENTVIITDGDPEIITL